MPGAERKYETNVRLGANLWGFARSRIANEVARTDGLASRREAPAVKSAGRMFGTLTLPNGQQIRTMREDAFQAALAATRIDTR